MYPYPKRVCGLRGEASPAQIKYVEAIHLLLGVEKPEEKTKQAYSDFINKYAKRYKDKVEEQLAMREAYDAYCFEREL